MERREGRAFPQDDWSLGGALNRGVLPRAVGRRGRDWTLRDPGERWAARRRLGLGGSGGLGGGARCARALKGEEAGSAGGLDKGVRERDPQIQTRKPYLRNLLWKVCAITAPARRKGLPIPSSLVSVRDRVPPPGPTEGARWLTGGPCLSLRPFRARREVEEARLPRLSGEKPRGTESSGWCVFQEGNLCCCNSLGVSVGPAVRPSQEAPPPTRSLVAGKHF